MIDLALPIPASKLIRHMSLFYSDRHIAEDLDCVLECCGSAEAARGVVRRYARLRRQARDFRPADWNHNNHAMIDPALLGKITGVHAGGIARQCVHCGSDFAPRRTDARYCSGRCRIAAHRVTDSASESLTA